ncbi:unnamed protein product [Rhizophagus irregularis]|nr:unnamed protein product [Rhizophagus irregularis]
MSLLFIIDIAICGTPKLNILRCDLKANHTVKEKIEGCNNYILPNVSDYGVFKKDCLTFKTNKTIKFSTKPDSDIAGYDQIGFYFYDDTTALEVGTIGMASLTILIIPSDSNPVTNPNNAISSQMDKATSSELKLQLNFIAGIAKYAAVKNFYNYFPFNNNPYDLPPGTTGYFSIAAGSFIQEQTSEERSNTVLGAIAAAGGAFGTMAGVIVIFFGDFRLSPRGIAHNFFNLVQNSKEFFERSRFYPKLELKFSKINDEDKALLVNEFSNIRYSIYYHLLNQSNIDEMSKDQRWFLNKLEYKLKNLYNKIYHWLLNTENIGKLFRVYKIDREYYKFSSINEEDERLLNNKINKIRYVIDVYLYDTKSKDQKKLAEYKYERELKFSDNTNNEDKELHIINEEDRKLLKDEFHKIRKLVDKHLLGKPNIEKIFNAYNSLQNNNFSEDMGEDKKLLTDVFQQISYVMFRHLLDIPEDKEIFEKYKENVQISNFFN